MSDEQQQSPTEVTQAVGDSNAATVASLSTSISGPEANAGVVSASADAAPLSTSTVASQEAGSATLGESVPIAADPVPSLEASAGNTAAAPQGGQSSTLTAPEFNPISNDVANDFKGRVDTTLTLPSGVALTGALQPTAAPSGAATSTAAERPVDPVHPAKPHIRGLLRKIEAGEAIVLADVESVLRRIEEML
ncbi:hypothetical protein [Burkholderia gladioli]|uniref:hypothetical protein n=1 Tax=Burkholderia gladioli TaxID=28095 RepID=UPI00062747F3|nr:hypothetical protein [Burkholderia gladioli]KKJ05642.1 hypothetical protein XF14_16305 [Burkholderia gladioli]